MWRSASVVRREEGREAPKAHRSIVASKQPFREESVSELGNCTRNEQVACVSEATLYESARATRDEIGQVHFSLLPTSTRMALLAATPVSAFAVVREDP